MPSSLGFYPQDCSPGALSFAKDCCNTGESGGIRHAALVPSGYQATLVAALDAAHDLTDATTREAAIKVAWDNAVSNNAVVMANVQGSYDGGTPTEVPGLGDAEIRVTGIKHTATWKTVTIIDRMAFFNRLQSRSDFVVWLATDEFIWNTKTESGFTVTLPIEEAKDTEVMANITAKWNDRELPEHYDRPDYLFEDCDGTTTLTIGVQDGAIPNPAPGASGNVTLDRGGTCEEDITGVTIAVRDSGGTLMSPSDFTATVDTQSNTAPVIAIAVDAGVADDTYTIDMTVNACGKSDSVTFDMVVTTI